MSDEHFTVDDPLIEAWAGQKSFQSKATVTLIPSPDDPGNPSVDFRGDRQANSIHVSTTDPEAYLYKKVDGPEAELYFLSYVLEDAQAPSRRIMLDDDKNYDAHPFVQDLWARRVTPHVTQHTTNG